MVSLTTQGGMKGALLFLVKLATVLGEIVPGPSNTAVVAGEMMTMNCPVTNDTSVRKWSLQSKNSVVSTIYLPGPSGGFHEDFKHFGVKVNANGPVTISANSTRSSDAGIYKCHCENDVTDVVYSAHLIVLESLPVRESGLTSSNSYTLIDGDDTRIQCSVNFRGFWEPSMEWTQHGERLGPEGKTVTAGIETVIIPSQSITSTLTIAVQSSADGFYYSCKLYFVKYNGTEVTTAKNVPNFTYTWNSSVICVSHSSTQSVSAVISSTTETSSSVDWNIASLCIVAALCLIFLLILTLAIRLKKKASEPGTCMRLSNIPDVANRQQEIPSGPVYTEVLGPRFRKEILKSEKRVPGFSVTDSHDPKSSRPMNYFGDDGTEYMEVKVVGRQPMPVRLPAASIMFSVVGEYASIDHTLSPPTIPPRGNAII